MHTKIQAHESSVPSEILTEPNLPPYCEIRHPSVAWKCPSTLYVIPSAVLDYPISFLCNCNHYFCVAKIVNCNVHIKTVKLHTF